MSARKVVIGCSVVALVTVAFLVIGGIVVFRRMTSAAPLPPAAGLVDSESLSLAVARLDPDDPWVLGTLAQLSKYSTRDQKPTEMFPLELVWTQRRALQGDDRHILALSLSRGGRIAGMVGDIMLWRAGRENHTKVSRVEHAREGITSFPGTPIPGHIFIRDNTFVWSSDLDTAKQAVDLISRVPADGGGGTPDAGEPTRVHTLVPKGAHHTLSGAIINENGSLAGSLALLPGETLDLPVETLAPVETVTFTLDTSSANEAGGEIILTFVPETPASTIAGIAQELSTRLSAVPIAQVTIEVTPRVEETRAVLSLKVGGLDSVQAPLLAFFTRSIKHVESIQSGSSAPEPPDTEADPNQSSSTFQ